jgi:hypothetical protein
MPTRRRGFGPEPRLRGACPILRDESLGGIMKHRFLRVALAAAGACGLLAGCATTVDWGTPLGHYRYSYDSRPVVHDDDTYHYDTYHAPAIVDRPAVTYYDDDDDD